MATQVQFRRGTTAQTSTFTGATAEITIDTDKEVVVVHDGVTAGGYPLARESALTANVASITGAFNTANAAFTTANSAGSYANSAFLVANSAASYSNTVNNTQNNSITAAFASANSAGVYANGAFVAANTADVKATSAGVYANGAFAAANAANATDTTQNNSITAAFTAANSSGVYANGAFTRANNSLNANTGGTVVGDVSITGNLTVSGLTTYTNTTTLLVADNIITVNAAINQSAQPTVNAGLEVDRGAQPNTSILWIETLGKWTANNGNGTITLAADSAESYANGAFARANLGSKSTASATAPGSPTIGDMWYDTDNDVLLRYTYDGTSNNWIDITGPIIRSTYVRPTYLITANAN